MALSVPSRIYSLPKKHHGRRITPAPVVAPVKWGLGCEQLQAIAGFGFEFVPIGRFLAFDAVLGPRHCV